MQGEEDVAEEVLSSKLLIRAAIRRRRNDKVDDNGDSGQCHYGDADWNRDEVVGC